MSRFRKEKEASFDVIVVGGGLTGLCAAMASARHGAKTALVQDRPVLGGNASSEIRMHICGASNNMRKPNAEETGIVRELLLENRRFNDYYNFSQWDRILHSAAKGTENLTLFLNTAMYDAETEGSRITSIDCYQLTTEIHWKLRAPLFADCTGNGTLGYMTGVPFRTGCEGKAEFDEPHAPPEPNGDRMGNTLLFKAVDRDEPVTFIPPKGSYHFTEEQLRFRKHADLRGEEAQADTIFEHLDAATRSLVTDAYCFDYGYWWIELTGEKEDIIEEYEDLRDELLRCVYGVWDHIKNGGDHGAQNYDLQWVGMLPGMRESRRMEGLYILNENDLIANRVFPDAVAYGGWASDNHVAHGLWDLDKMPSEIFDFDGLYTIPYRSYVARGIDNLFIGGRCHSASKLAMASSRVMGTCAVGGQAIGTAAALCKKHGCCPAGLMEHITELQQTLLRDDCYIPGYRNEDPLDLARQAALSASSERLPAALVVNGIARAEEGCENCWESDGIREDGELLTLRWPEAQTLRQLRLTFDPNLNHCIKITLSSVRIAEQGRGVAPELVRDYDVECFLQGKLQAVREVRDNYQRLNVLDLDPVLCDEVRIRVRATNGAPNARIFEVRAYA